MCVLRATDIFNISHQNKTFSFFWSAFSLTLLKVHLIHFSTFHWGFIFLSFLNMQVFSLQVTFNHGSIQLCPSKVNKMLMTFVTRNLLKTIKQCYAFVIAFLSSVSGKIGKPRRSEDGQNVFIFRYRRFVNINDLISRAATTFIND